MGLNNLNDIRKLKTRLPESKIQEIQADGDKVIASASVYKQNKLKNLESASIEKPVQVKAENTHVLRQEFLDSRPIKNENYVKLETKPEPRVVEKPKPLKFEYDLLKEEDKPSDEDLSFKDFYVKEKGKYTKFKFLLLIIFIIFTYFMITFSYRFFISSSNYKSLKHTDADQEIVVDIIGKDAPIFNTEENNVVNELSEIVSLLEKNEIPEERISNFVDDYILNDITIETFTYDLDREHVNALTSYIVNDLLYKQAGAKIRRIVIDEEMLAYSSVMKKGNKLVINPVVMDLGLEDLNKAFTKLIINAVVDDEHAYEKQELKPSKYVDYKQILTNNIRLANKDDFYRMKDIAPLFASYKARLDEIDASTESEDIKSIKIYTTDEDSENAIEITYFTKKLYPKVLKNIGGEVNEIVYDGSVHFEGPTDVSLTAKFSTNLNEGEELIFTAKDTTNWAESRLFQPISINSNVLSEEIFNLEFEVVEFTKDEVTIEVDERLDDQFYMLCIKRSREIICDEKQDDNVYTFGDLVFDSELPYKFYIIYELNLKASDVKLLNNYNHKLSVRVDSLVVESKVAKEKQPDQKDDTPTK